MMLAPGGACGWPLYMRDGSYPIGGPRWSRWGGGGGPMPGPTGVGYRGTLPLPWLGGELACFGGGSECSERGFGGGGCACIDDGVLGCEWPWCWWCEGGCERDELLCSTVYGWEETPVK